MSALVVGIVTANLRGEYSLWTFEGTYRITEATIEEAFEKIRQDPDFAEVKDERVVNRLARGLPVGGEVRAVSFLLRGKEWPSRPGGDT